MHVCGNDLRYHTETYSVPSGALQSLEAVWFVEPTKVFLRWRKVPCTIKMDRSLARLQGIMQLVVLTEMCRGTRQKQQIATLMALLQTLRMPSKWQLSNSMGLNDHSVKLSY